MYDVDLDRVINYETEYSNYLKKAKITGRKMTALCPFHDDHNNSFSVNLDNGKYNCFACGESGNFITFYGKQHGLDNKQAYKEICEQYNIDFDEADKKSSSTKKSHNESDSAKDSNPKPYSLQEYAEAKRIPAEWLESQCRLSTEKDRNTGTTYLKIPYFGSDGTEKTFRKRYAEKQFRWKWGSAGKIGLYGEWRLAQIEKAGYAILVEGESDTQSLWYLGFATLGSPGANMFKSEFCNKVKGLRLYIHVEPDQGGQTFLQKTLEKLKEGEFKGKVFSWSCEQFDVKDPSDLYIKYGFDEAKKLIHEAIDNAKEIDLDEIRKQIPTAIEDAPINLRQPSRYHYDNDGIFSVDINGGKTLVCRTPIIITQRLQSTKHYNEKIEIAYKRDNRWHTAIFNRSTIFQARNIVSLADYGCTITSENAKKVVGFLQELEAANMDVIRTSRTTSTYGWQCKGQFLPGSTDSRIILDIEPAMQGWAEAFEQRGTLDEWKAMIQPYRSRSKFRFILAASFAAPLLRILKQRTFTVYNWGNSKGGKTAALKAALSAWGNPENLMVNFNITQVALEKMAEFFCDLPIGIDERQLAGNKNQNQIERYIYMLSSEIGKSRGSKTGGLQQVSRWKTIALMTGEEPISLDTTQAGVNTRTIELYGGPFQNEIEASKMHQDTTRFHGTAGPEFIKKVISTSNEEILDKFELMRDELSKYSGGKNGAHIADISVISLADAMLDSFIFNDSDTILDDSFVEAYRMAISIFDEQLASGAVDVNESAKQFINDWIMCNERCFGELKDNNAPCYGNIMSSGDVYIFPSVFDKALKDAGYSPRKVRRYLADEKLIEISVDKTGKKIYSSSVWFAGKTCRMVVYHLGKATGNEDKTDYDDSEPFE